MVLGTSCGLGLAFIREVVKMMGADPLLAISATVLIKFRYSSLMNASRLCSCFWDSARLLLSWQSQPCLVNLRGCLFTFIRQI